MKNALLILLCLTAFGCSKNSDIVTRQGIDISFTKDYPLSDARVWNKPFNVKSVLLWKAENRDMGYNGINGFDKISQKNIAPDFIYSNISSQVLEVPSGKYFIAYLTDGNEDPKLAYSSTTINVSDGTFLKYTKNVTSLSANSSNAW